MATLSPAKVAFAKSDGDDAAAVAPAAVAVGGGGAGGREDLSHSAGSRMDYGTVRLDDGTGVVAEGADERFVKWLKDNGAEYPKIQWPARDTVGGVRGTVATEDIEVDEDMVIIPKKLVLSPPLAKASPEIGHIYEKHPELFAGDDDRVLVAYMIFERLRGAESFWAPYFDILPMPGSIADWSGEELAELQHTRLELEARTRHPRMKLVFERVFDVLCSTYPGLFPREKVTYQLFHWAWGTIQARAFGRRLPWTGLVPFADCLNHASVATKYDFDVEGNGVFRLRPTNTNRYKKGQEVFNSYGRRDNRHLLLEYGFAIEDNEWESYDFAVAMPTSTPHYEEKLRMLNRILMMNSSRTYRLLWRVFNLDVLCFFRIFVAEPEELENEDLVMSVHSGPLSMRNEIAALGALATAYSNEVGRFRTTLEDDEDCLRAARVGDTDKGPRYVTSLVARITRKRIVLQQKAWVDAILPLVMVAEEQGGQLRTMRDPVTHYLGTIFSTVRKMPPPPRRRDLR